MRRVGLSANFVAKEKPLSNLEASQKKNVSTEVTTLKWKTLYIFLIIKKSQIVNNFFSEVVIAVKFT